MRVALVTNEVARGRISVAHKREAPAGRTQLLLAPGACDGSDTRLRALLADGRVAPPRNHRRFHPLGFDAWDVKVRSEFVATPRALRAAGLDHFCHRGTGSHHSVAAGTVAFSAHVCPPKPLPPGTGDHWSNLNAGVAPRLLVHHAARESRVSGDGAIPSGM